MSELIGKIVCGYRIMSEVGEGGMGKVYLAESAFLTEYKQQVAIKTLTTYASSEKQAAILRDLFTREANIQVQFKHPHIVSVIQFALEGDQHFLILEYMPGYQHQGRRMSNVADVISYETGPIPHKRALRWFIQALDAMHYAHNFKYRWEGEERVGIVHRDIKPANLLLMDSTTVKVSDFGIVKVQQRSGFVTQKLTPGTSAYMSPEAVLGPQNYGLTELDARSDIYSLGVTLYEMLAGRLPFSPDSETNPDISLRRKNVSDEPPPPSAFYPGVPQQLDQLVLRALEKRPENRYQSAAEFKKAILALDPQFADAAGEESPKTYLDTTPFSTPTDRIQPVTTASGTGKPYDPHATSVLIGPAATQAQSQPHLPAISSAGASKLLWVIGAAVLIIAITATGFFLRNRDARETSAINITGADAKTQSPPLGSLPPAPEGMAMIPEGSYMMGRDLNEEERNYEIVEKGLRIKIFSYDYPAHPVNVSTFYLDKTEVSNTQYAVFVKAIGHRAPQEVGWNGTDPPANADLEPVTGVAYQDAVDYCSWLTTQRNDGLRYRLPTEEEWEYAARGKDAGKPGAPVNLYPWGEQWNEGYANTREARLDHPRNVNSYLGGKSPFDILNLAGNVAEWTATDFNHYPGSNQPTPREPGYQGIYQVVRGGAYFYPKEYAMTTTRVWARPEDKGPRLGFRCAADARR